MQICGGSDYFLGLEWALDSCDDEDNKRYKSRENDAKSAERAHRDILDKESSATDAYTEPKSIFSFALLSDYSNCLTIPADPRCS